MLFTLRVSADRLDPQDVAGILEAAALQLRQDGKFGEVCADGFTTRGVCIDPYGTYKLSA